MCIVSIYCKRYTLSLTIIAPSNRTYSESTQYIEVNLSVIHRMWRKFMAQSESRRKKTTAQKHQSTRAYKVRVLLWKHFETWFIIYDIRGIRLFPRMHPLSTLSISSVGSHNWLNNPKFALWELQKKHGKRAGGAQAENLFHFTFLRLNYYSFMKKTLWIFWKKQKAMCCRRWARVRALNSHSSLVNVSALI